MSTIAVAREDLQAGEEDLQQFKRFLGNPIAFLGQRITLVSLPLAAKIVLASEADVESVVRTGQTQPGQATEYDRLVATRRDGLELREMSTTGRMDKVQDVLRVRGRTQLAYVVGKRRPTTTLLQRCWRALEGTTIEWRMIYRGRMGSPFKSIPSGSIALSPDGNRVAYWGERFRHEVGPTGAQHILVIDGHERVASRRLGRAFFDASSRHYAYLAMPGKGVSALGAFTGSPDPVCLGIDGAESPLPEKWVYVEFKEFNERAELRALVYEPSGFSQYTLAQYRLCPAN